MKRFFEGVMKWKTSACLMFTGAVAIYLCFCLAFGRRQVPTQTLWGLLLMCALGSLIQGLCFSNWVFKKMRYTWRSLLFVGLFLPLLSLIAWKFQWFPTQRAESWAIFLGLFFLIFILMTVGFEIYFRSVGRKYDGLIGQYRRQKEEDEGAG